MTTVVETIKVNGMIGEEKVEKLLKVNEDYIILDDIGYASDYLFFPDYLDTEDVDIKKIVVGFEYNNDVYAFSKNALKELFDNRAPFLKHGLHIDTDVEYFCLSGFNKEFNEHIEFDLKYIFRGNSKPNTKVTRINSLSEFPIWNKIKTHLEKTLKVRELDLTELMLPEVEEEEEWI